MRKSLWITLAVMVLVVSAPNAHADNFTYTYTSTDVGTGCMQTSLCLDFSFTTESIAPVTSATTLTGAELTSSTESSFLTGFPITQVTLDAGGVGTQLVSFVTQGTFNLVDGFSLADYSTPGTYTATPPSDDFDTLVVTDVTTNAPEPSSLALMLLGVGLVFVMRKRNSRGNQLAT